MLWVELLATLILPYLLLTAVTEAVLGGHRPERLVRQLRRSRLGSGRGRAPTGPPVGPMTVADEAAEWLAGR